MAAQTTSGTKPRISLTLILLVVTPVSLATIIALVTLNTIGPSGPGMREFALIIGVWCAVSLGGGVVAHFIGSRHQYDPGGGLKDIARLDENIAANGSGQSDFAVNDLTTDPEDIGVPLVEDKRRIEAFLRGIGDSVTIVDLDFKIIYMNDTAKKIFGDRIGESCYSVFEHKNDVCGGCPIKRSYQTEKVETSLRRVYTKEDKLLYMENSGSPIRDEADRIIGGIELARDVTQRIRLERNI